MHKFKELNVWQKAVDLAVDVYQVTKKFPSEERFGLTSQMNRCLVSIPSNIAEGAGRNTDGEFNHFLGVATGSSFELETQLIIANKLNILHEDDFKSTSKSIQEIQNMLFGLQKSLSKN
ncbi:MAG: four helix bundle protein [Bacteroidetes bacterium]|nr:four helix bundle protein [Bacteroidota bacterium]